MFEVLVAALTTLLLAPLMIIFGRRFGIEGIDVHKPWKPRIPKTGGLAIILGSAAGISMLLWFSNDGISFPILAACLIAGLIGFYEDLQGEINPKLKPLLLVFASLPILFLGAYTPRPVIPFLGRTRLYRVYPVLVMISYPVVCNAVNSVDVLNGSVILTSIPFLVMSITIFYLRGDYRLMMIAFIILASCIAILPYNLYPARTFIGNSGSLFLGAAMTSIAIVGRMEMAAIIALIPQIMNEMHVIFSIGGLRSAKFVEKRPVRLEDGMLTASREKDAPITLLRMICAEAKVSEKTAVWIMMIIACFTAMLGLLTDVLFIEGMIQ